MKYKQRTVPLELERENNGWVRSVNEFNGKKRRESGVSSKV